MLRAHVCISVAYGFNKILLFFFVCYREAERQNSNKAETVYKTQKFFESTKTIHKQARTHCHGTPITKKNFSTFELHE